MLLHASSRVPLKQPCLHRYYLLQESLTKRRYAGFAPDDITVMVIDVKKQADPAAASRGVASTHGSSMEETGTGAMCGCFGGVKRSTSSPTI